MSRCWFSALLLSAMLFALPGWSQPGNEKLYTGFQDPPREYTVRPFWFWNGKLDAKEVNRQIEEMVSQGVYGAFVHNRTGLETPYLSEDYFQVVGAALKRSKELGFHFSVCDEYEWPSGEARDVWRKGLPSKVIGANPEFRMRSLGYVEREVTGPKHVEIEGVQDFQFAIAGRMTGPDSIDENTLVDVSSSFAKGKLDWDAPDGHWVIFTFYLFPAQGFDGAFVDLMNPAAVRKYLDLVYEEYYKRFPEYFGNIIDATYADHEGTYGYKLAWTPALFQTFESRNGYDVRKYLPLLIHDGGKLTPKVRCDYLDTISELYATSFFKQVATWGKAHDITVTGHVWEEYLQREAAFEGDLQRIMRNWGWPGVDSLFDYGRSPRDFKATASVAHFRGTRFTTENQGLHGSESFLDPQKMRLGTNTMGAWGTSLFIPHAFNYNRQRIEYPADWFYHQPYWKHFKHYADYARRLSYMNDSTHVADVLLYEPTESVWAHADPVFSVAKWNASPNPISFWSNTADTINRVYSDLQTTLVRERWDFDTADSYFLAESKIEDRLLHIGPERFRVVVLPPVTTMRRGTARKLVQFFDGGGTIIATGLLPTDSMDEGRNDAEIRSAMRHIFGDDNPQAAVEQSNSAGGRAFFVKDDVNHVTAILAKQFAQDVKVQSGPREHLYYSHHRKDGSDFYWLVNDTDDARDATITFAAGGIPERWDAETGAREPLFYRSSGNGTELRLSFAPWDAYYIVFRPGSRPEQSAAVDKTNLESIAAIEKSGEGLRVHGTAPLDSAEPITVELTDGDQHYRGTLARRAVPAVAIADEWSFTPERKTMKAPYAATRRDYRNEGERQGWQTKSFQDSTWSRTWLSRERFTIRQWSLIGPFPNEDYSGFNAVLPPEQSFNPEAGYPGIDGRTVRWMNWDETSNYYTELADPLNMAPNRLWVTALAHTYIYSPVARRVQVRTTADNNAKVWVNGKNLLDWLIVPFYFEMREDFAMNREADLHAGWNELLLKISRGPRGQFAFMARVTDDQGNNIDDLVFSREKRDPASSITQNGPVGSTWLRVPVPVTATAVRLPRLDAPFTIFYNGTKLTPAADGSVRFDTPARGADNVLAINLPGDATLRSEPEFQLGSGRLKPGSWTNNGLAYYSGSGTYEQEVTIPKEYAGARLMLDCGQVGSTAEIFVNDKPAGTRVWLPYRVDATKLLHPGKNKIRIVVTNMMEAERAVENRASHLDKIKLNGLLGPVRIVPYVDATIDCKAAVTSAARR